MPRSKIEEWQRWMPEWESLRWPVGMMRSFVSFTHILNNLDSSRKQGPQVCIIAGSEDKLVGASIPSKLAETFRNAIRTQIKDRKLDRPDDDAHEERAKQDEEIPLTTISGVRFVVLKGAPHHFQNDVQQEFGARQLLSFVEELR